MNRPQPTAAVLVIGNEILSGRTQDANVAFIAKRLAQRGIRLAEVRIVPDIEAVVVEAVNALRDRYDTLFTTGGIGPTHDDITADCVAKAFGAELEVNAEARAILERYYGERGDELTAARLRMARAPVGATLVENPISKAPGFRMQNVIVLAGVPKIMQAQFDGVIDTLDGGVPITSKTVTCYAAEGALAAILEAIQTDHPDVDVGSYPFFRGGRVGTAVVNRGADAAQVASAADAVRQAMTREGIAHLDGEEADPKPDPFA